MNNIRFCRDGNRLVIVADIGNKDDEEKAMKILSELTGLTTAPEVRNLAPPPPMYNPMEYAVEKTAEAVETQPEAEVETEEVPFAEEEKPKKQAPSKISTAISMREYIKKNWTGTPEELDKTLLRAGNNKNVLYNIVLTL